MQLYTPEAKIKGSSQNDYTEEEAFDDHGVIATCELPVHWLVENKLVSQWVQFNCVKTG